VLVGDNSSTFVGMFQLRHLAKNPARSSALLGARIPEEAHTSMMVSGRPSFAISCAMMAVRAMRPA
jgi:hypothetical protein